MAIIQCPTVGNHCFPSLFNCCTPDLGDKNSPNGAQNSPKQGQERDNNSPKRGRKITNGDKKYPRSTLHTELFRTLHPTLYTLRSALYTVRFTCIPGSTFPTPYITLYPVTLHTTRPIRTLHSTLCTPHFALYTLHSPNCTLEPPLHTTLRTLHSVL